MNKNIIRTGAELLQEYNNQPQDLETFKTLEEMIDDLLELERLNQRVRCAMVVEGSGNRNKCIDADIDDSVMYTITVDEEGDMFYGTEAQLLNNFGVYLFNASVIAEENNATFFRVKGTYIS